MKVVGIPLSEGEMATLTKAPAAAQAVSPGPTVGSELPSNFWWLWIAGTVVPIAAIIVLALAGASASVVVPIGIVAGCCVAANVGLALATEGYQHGDLVEVGRAVAVVTGWLGTALLVAAVIAALLIVVISILIAAAIVAALASAGSR